jgi:hypothetical protein
VDEFVVPHHVKRGDMLPIMKWRPSPKHWSNEQALAAVTRFAFELETNNADDSDFRFSIQAAVFGPR